MFITRKQQGSEQYLISKSNLASANMHKHSTTYLITFCNLADDFTSGRIEGWKGFLAHSIMPLVVNEELEESKPRIKCSIKYSTRVIVFRLLKPWAFLHCTTIRLWQSTIDQYIRLPKVTQLTALKFVSH